MISAWLNTKLERDKQLLSLSTSAIGLLVTLLRTVGVSNFSQVLIFSAALIAFLFTVISVIWILGKNANHIEEMLNGSETESRHLAFFRSSRHNQFCHGHDNGGYNWYVFGDN